MVTWRSMEWPQLAAGRGPPRRTVCKFVADRNENVHWDWKIRGAYAPGVHRRSLRRGRSDESHHTPCSHTQGERVRDDLLGEETAREFLASLLEFNGATRDRD